MVGPNFLSIFASSPIKPLQDHIDEVVKAARGLPDFVKAIYSQNWDKAKALYEEIHAHEKRADEIKRKIRMRVSDNLFMPVPRSDILELLTTQDTVANKAKDIAGLLLGRKMQFPPSIAEDYQAFLNRSLDAVNHAQRAIHELDELLETGFRGVEAESVERIINELDEIETDTDQLQVKIREKLFAIEKDLPPIDAMFLYKALDLTGDLANKAQRVGHRMQLLLAS
jgi:uncharacterized protein